MAECCLHRYDRLYDRCLYASTQPATIAERLCNVFLCFVHSQFTHYARGYIYVHSATYTSASHYLLLISYP